MPRVGKIKRQMGYIRGEERSESDKCRLGDRGGYEKKAASLAVKGVTERLLLQSRGQRKKR